jgi:hypothetical protein
VNAQQTIRQLVHLARLGWVSREMEAKEAEEKYQAIRAEIAAELRQEERSRAPRQHAGSPTVTICGSTRFMQEMVDADRLLTWTGHAVFKPGCDMKTPHPLWADPADAEAGKQRLDSLHRDKIRRAAWVLVVGDYAGDSTRSEIKYAHSLGTPVRFTDPGLAAEFDGDVGQPEAVART